MVREMECLFYTVKEHVLVCLFMWKLVEDMIVVYKHVRPLFRGNKLLKAIAAQEQIGINAA